MKNNKVLIIEDEEELCYILKRFLSKKRFDVDYAMNLKDGLDCLKKTDFDVLILDNNLPDGKGMDLIPRIRAAMPKITIIAISALGLKPSALAAGASFFIEKPVSLSEIYHMITSLQFPKMTLNN